MKIFRGITKKVPNEEQFEAYNKGLIELSEVKLIDTLKMCSGEKNEFEMLPIRLSYQEVDKHGNEKYTYDGDKDMYTKVYKQTPILYAYGKEMRILIELGEYAPVKLVCAEQTRDEKVFYKIECIQNQHMGLE